jgi:hypothetical protein
MDSSSAGEDAHYLDFTLTIGIAYERLALFFASSASISKRLFRPLFFLTTEGIEKRKQMEI